MWKTRVWSLGWEDPLEKFWQLTPVFLPGESHGWRSLAGGPFSYFISVSVQMFIPNCKVISLSQLFPFGNPKCLFLSLWVCFYFTNWCFVSVFRLFLGVTACASSLSDLLLLSVSCPLWPDSLHCVTAECPLLYPFDVFLLYLFDDEQLGPGFQFLALESMLQWNFRWTNVFSLQFHSDISTGVWLQIKCSNN